jgi:hypothetical protein
MRAYGFHRAKQAAEYDPNRLLAACCRSIDSILSSILLCPSATAIFTAVARFAATAILILSGILTGSMAGSTTIRRRTVTVIVKKCPDFPQLWHN